jgi:hypothetical protein
MALATYEIADSIEWAKKFAFARGMVLGNGLEPALTSAYIVTQTILSPPFEWWWNNEELVFTCNPTPNSATSTAISIVSGVLTVTATNTFAPGNLLLPSAIAGGSAALNGQVIEVDTATGSSFTAKVNFPNSSDTTGTFTNLTTQDYTIPTPEFSHIEHASVLDLDAQGNPLKWYELTIKNTLSLENVKGRPEFISPHTEDGQGNTTFRVSAAPSKKFPVSVHIQKVAPLYTSINQVWGVPDFMMPIYNWGFLALMWQFADDPRAAYASNQFKAGLLGRAEGLTEEQKNIFLNNWEDLQAGFMMKMQQGIAARGQ